MICQECKERPATFHFKKVVNGEKNEVHICEQCAQENSEVFLFDGGNGFSINNLLSGLLNFDSPFAAKPEKSFVQNQEVLQCPNCKMTFQQFTKAGRFGCSECYKTFHHQITPILRRVHSGNTAHAGKIPKRIGGNIHLQKRIEDLKKELQELIAQEEFEKAALIRDDIRSLENDLKRMREEDRE
ncbi:UvrB/UvrC motif-containing protein [Metabacillus arenae]|uniref:UvrB/UvrC motif-containing protein n=1 Tax=Metabacillus arenae TaxID=2771434 RepID=A0A926NJD4_9BACI|nr:UvrB/UvrC motif-containing protein [Metabacillus arenae]MBD1382794.1 UvrB/UvrC motif-containing protein [Metabacillus arenae]